ncbi:MAG TPA: tetraacyldisaccharide 4'-kinase [Candidatus Acidoferrales bacterium]|nr:tetraacyldisaccharide 4'-kinase [Candidatus Acidoferrales bacterium]
MNEFWRSLLWPFSLLYRLGIWLRLRLYRLGILRQRRLGGYVVSVGNLTAGGTGKTPMVIWLAEQLSAAGEPVAVLTRGYRSVLLPGDGQPEGERPRRVSDEAVVLESHLGDRVPIGVGADRYRSGRELERKGVKWFVLDDGFQHLELARDADLVLIDATNPFGGDMLLPAGRLREPPSALERADAVIITRAAAAPEVESRVRRFTPAPIFYAQTELTGLIRISPGTPRPATDGEHAGRFLAFCGTGNPQAFFDDLRRWGFRVAGTARFPDHYRFTQRRVNELEDLAKELGADAMACTEKDMLNLSGLRFSRFPVFACRIVLRPADSAGLWQAVLETVERRRGKAG